MPKKSIAKNIAIGAGITVAIVAVAGTYFLYGSKNAAKNRKKVKAWTLKAKGEILEKLEKLSEVSEEAYNKIIDDVSEKYKKVKNIDRSDIQTFTKELKGHWKKMQKEIKKRVPRK